MMSEIGMTANRTSRERVGGTIGCSMSAWIETGIMKANLPELKHVSMKRIWTAAAPGGGWEGEAAADDGSSASKGRVRTFRPAEGSALRAGTAACWAELCTSQLLPESMGM